MTEPSREPVRLSKAVIALTGCSRREADLYIEGGWVTVDGRVVEEPQLKILDQVVELLPGARAEPVEPVTILLHKPAGLSVETELPALLALLTAEARVLDESDPVVINSLRQHFQQLAAPMSLEPRAGGLLVLTQDWQVTRKLSEDASSLEQEYIVEVSGQIAADGLAHLNRPIRIKGWPMPAVKVSWQNETRLRFAGKAIDTARIDALCESVGLRAESIKRIRIGSVAMSKLQPGQWRYLAPHKRF